MVRGVRNFHNELVVARDFHSAPDVVTEVDQFQNPPIELVRRVIAQNDTLRTNREHGFLTLSAAINRKRLHLIHLSEECAALLDKAGDFVEVNISEDPHYHVATDRLA